MRRTLLTVLLVLTVAAAVSVAGCERATNSTGVRAPVPLTLDAQRQRVSPQAHYVATAVCPDGRLEIYQYADSRTMRWLLWQNADTCVAFNVWPVGDTLVNDQPQLSMGSWWRCIRTWSNSCSDRYPNDNAGYVKCIASAVAGCAIGSAIAWVYLDSWNWW